MSNTLVYEIGTLWCSGIIIIFCRATAKSSVLVQIDLTHFSGVQARVSSRTINVRHAYERDVRTSYSVLTFSRYTQMSRADALVVTTSRIRDKVTARASFFISPFLRDLSAHNPIEPRVKLMSDDNTFVYRHDLLPWRNITCSAVTMKTCNIIKSARFGRDCYRRTVWLCSFQYCARWETPIHNALLITSYLYKYLCATLPGGRSRHEPFFFMWLCVFQ